MNPPKPPSGNLGALPYGPGKPVIRPTTPPPMEPMEHVPFQAGSKPTTSQPIDNKVLGTIPGSVQGVPVVVTFEQQGPALTQQGTEVAAVLVTWVYEGLGKFSMEEDLFIPLSRIGTPGWKEEALKTVRPALIASLEQGRAAKAPKET